MRRIEELEGEFLSLWEDIAEARGFDRVLGRILCILMLEGRPLSQNEIAEKTGYSVPSVSRALNRLASLGSVRKTRKPRARTTLYHVGFHPAEMMSGGLAAWILVARAMEQRIAQLQRRIGESKAEDPQRAERLTAMLTRLSSSLPKMIEAVERALYEIRKLA